MRHNNKEQPVDSLRLQVWYDNGLDVSGRSFNEGRCGCDGVAVSLARRAFIFHTPSQQANGIHKSEGKLRFSRMKTNAHQSWKRIATLLVTNDGSLQIVNSFGAHFLGTKH